MGNTFGRVHQNAYDLYVDPELTPCPLEEPTFDPKIGFPKGRKERVAKATPQELVSAKIPLRDRDYCAHLLLDYKSCRRDVWPWAVKCAHEKHAYLQCQYEDFILRMKEYEREKRLRKREKVASIA